MKQTFKIIRQGARTQAGFSTIGASALRTPQTASSVFSMRPVTSNQIYRTSFRSFAATTQNVPTMGDSISEGVVESFVKQVGQQVKADEVIARIETDKVTVDILSKFAGVITKYHASEGDTVAVGAKFVDIDPSATPGAAPVQAAAPKQESAPIPTPTPKAAEPTPIPKASTPVAPAAPTPTPSSSPSSTAGVNSVSSKKAPSEITGARLETRVPMNKMRQTIARRLKESQNTNASLTTFNEIDMSAFMDIRTKMQDAFTKKHGVKLGFMSAFMKASVQALKEQPVVNAVIDNNEMVYRDFIDISTAVSTPTGLVVPVIRNCQEMNFHHLELALADLAKRARDGKITLEDMAGGTFTITNGGVFGSMMGTPIINMPQSAILGMHATKVRPVVVGSQILARPIMYVALTYDHRIIDGREAVLFLKKIKECIEEPQTILFDI